MNRPSFLVLGGAVVVFFGSEARMGSTLKRNSRNYMVLYLYIVKGDGTAPPTIYVVMRGFYLFVVLVCAFALQMHEDQKSKVNHLLHLHAL